MPSWLLPNLNVALSFGFPRAARVNQSQPLHLIETLFTRSGKNRMAASSSMVASGDVVVDTLLSSCGNVSGFLKPGGVFYGDRSFKVCRKARVSIRSGGNGSPNGFRESPIFDFVRRCSSNSGGARSSKGMSEPRSFSSSCYSDGNAPEVSSDGSLSVETLSSLALSTDDRSRNHSVLKLVSGVCYMPHPEKLKTGGEDAHFICEEEQVIGVADGVGGWADVGVNAGIYARELMSNSVKAIRENTDSDVDPLLVLEKAHARTNAMGSSTACIICLRNQDLHAINLGDSGFTIVRDGQIIFESPVQQHGFNFTFQLERGNTGDMPSSGQVFKIPVVAGDVIVAGSDGLFDNLYNKEIAAIVGDSVRDCVGPDETAKKIADVARARALDRKHRTPFSTAAQEAGYAYYGGKLDDLTVLVSFVSA
ncbi:hypothetical protein ABFS82_08G074300 [Erythranthe guttata]